MSKKTINISETELRSMISSSIKRNMLKEEEEQDNVQEADNSGFKSKATNFLNKLEGYHQALKVLHWTAENNHKHTLTDDIDGSVLKFEDKVAEVVMGIIGERITSLDSDKPSSTDLKGLLDELKRDILEFLDEFEDKRDYRGLVNVCDDFLSDVETDKYLDDLK